MKLVLLGIALAILVQVMATCALAALRDREVKRKVARGKAAYYGENYRGHRMANGAQFDPDARTCASFAYPLGAVLRVRSLLTGRSVVVTVTDRGPALRLNRLIDLSARAFGEIAPHRQGVIEVEVELLAAEGAPKGEVAEDVFAKMPEVAR